MGGWFKFVYTPLPPQVGYSLLLKKEKMIEVDNRRVTICNGATFGCISMEVGHWVQGCRL